MRNIAQEAAGNYPPEELRERRQWVCHRAKVPYRATGPGLASSTDPATWATYEQAVEACRRHHHDGVGFVFTPDDPFTGIDLDHCRNPETGELAPWAAEIVAMFPGAYVEASPSGTGVHIITRGTAPHNGSQAYCGGKVEMYDRGRYFTVTAVPL